MSPYVGIVILLAIASGFVGLTISPACWWGPAGTTGPSTTRTSAASSPRRNLSAAAGFPVKYYITAMLFIVFDIEIVFLYPWAVALT